MNREPKCTIAASIRVVTIQKGKKDRHGSLERRIEGILSRCYSAYMDMLVRKLPNSEKYSWKQINKHTKELITTEAV